MASSGTINNTFRAGYAIRITWQVTSQSTANNTSTITANVQLVSLGNSYTIVSSSTKYGTLTVNGTSYDFSLCYLIRPVAGTGINGHINIIAKGNY